MPSDVSGRSAVLTMLDVLDRDLEKPVFETENGLVIGDRLDPDRTRIANKLRRIVVDPAIGHPRFRLNADKPVRQRGNTPLAILAHMLLADPADGNDPARAVDQAATAVTFSIIDPNGVMFLGSVDE